jgi:hypothetical protein|tara:strand:+ start:917 stop:1453 length:537 start_codon:yes stop_codon:yes gene_type:complete
MKLPIRCDKTLSKVCATKKDLRDCLQSPWLENGNLYATNGHIVARIPVETEPGETNGEVKMDAITAAAKLAPKGDKPQVIANGNLQVPNGPEFPRSTEIKYPNVTRIFEETTEREHDLTVTFNADLLSRLSAAIRKDGKPGGVRLKFKNDPNAPILVETFTGNSGECDAIGILMPMQG